MDIENGMNVLIEDKLDRFAAMIFELIKHRKLTMRLGNVAKELVAENYD